MTFSYSAFSVPPAILIAAFLLDIAIGDPRWLPHPVRIIGSAISRIERHLRSFITTAGGERLAGTFLAAVIVASSFAVTFFIANGAQQLRVIGIIVLIYLTATTIAVRELVGSAQAVIKAVKDKDIETARNNLGMIVGRDTENLAEESILKASVETLSENLSDGVIAPVFYLVLGGLPLAMAYKAINTLDSMVGYKNDRYKNFGWAAARLDDIANYIPARITGVLIAVSSALALRSLPALRSSVEAMLRDGRKHTSPNAGIPEAAAAGGLGIRLGGPSTYGGIVVHKPYIGIKSANDYLSALEKTITIVKLSSVLSIGIAVSILYIRSLL
ncbi:MAG: adenosylcobinamide-phosphate synthase CbiB [Thermodesulfovibrionales bacterium]|nr:adenosylcobinamide-phosphate synthase CbiB [Thermodesulfovibrionales bacterium]